MSFQRFGGFSEGRNVPGLLFFDIFDSLNINSIETMCLTNKDEESLKLFERKMQRRILGPKRTDDGEYRILINHEIENIMEGENIVKNAKVATI